MKHVYMQKFGAKVNNFSETNKKKSDFF